MVLPFITDPWFYVAAVPAVLLFGISKGGFGSGFGILAVPLMTLVVSPTRSAAILLPILCVMDLVGLGFYRGKWDRRNMRILLPAGVAGIAVGAASFRYLDDNAIEVLLGLISLGFLLVRAIRSRLAARPAEPARVAPGLFWGTLSGFTSFVAHSGGPPIVVYLLPQRLDKIAFAATNVIFFAVVNYVKLVPYAWLGQFDTSNLWTSALLLPLAPIGVRLGMWATERVSERNFYRIAYTLLALSGVKLLWDGVSGLSA